MSTVTPNNGSQFSSDLRIATFAIAIFDYVQTLPGEYRLYKKQKEAGKISLVCVLFIIVRYMSIVCLVLNGIGFYYKDFTAEKCAKFYLAPLLTKMVAGLACEGIIFSRTYAISRDRRTLLSLSVLCTLLLPMQILGNSYKRHPVVGTGEVEGGNCTAKRFAGDFNSAPLYYLANLIFDVIACGIASLSLLRRHSVLGNLSLFAKKVLKHGLLFAFGATITNLLVFLALMELPVIKNLGAFLSVAITMILAQHLVLATAGTSGDSREESSSWEIRERSKSREPAPRRTFGGPGGGVSRIIGRDRGTESRLDRIELGGIRIQTETEVHRNKFDNTPSVDERLSAQNSSTPSDVKQKDGLSPSTSLDELSTYGDAEDKKYKDKRLREVQVATAV